MKSSLRIAAVLLTLALAPLGAEAAVPVSGPTPWAIILCKFSDRPDEPYTPADIEPFFSDAGRGTGTMFDYWNDMSFGNVDLTGSQAFGWFTVASTYGHYRAMWFDDPGSVKDAHQSCLDAAKGVPLQDFFGTIVIWNSAEVGVDYSGWPSHVSLPSGTSAMGLPEPMPTAWAMGRAYGLQPSVGLIPGTGREAIGMDPLDAMSSPTTFWFTDPDWGRSGPGLSGANRALMGWIDPAKLVEVPLGKKKTIVLDSLSNPAGNNALVARGWVSANTYYDMDVRTTEGWDSGMPGGSAIFTRRVGPDGVTHLALFSFGGGRFFDTTYDVQTRIVDVLPATVEIGPIGPAAKGQVARPPDVGQWHTKPVDFNITAQHVMPRAGLPLITVELRGAQSAAPVTVSGTSTTVHIKTEGETDVLFSAADQDGNVGDVSGAFVRLDWSPPVSTVALTAGSGGYTAAITSSDAASGVKEIHFSLDDFTTIQVVPGAHASVPLPVAGWTRLLYRAVDVAGNEEGFRTLSGAPHLILPTTPLELQAEVNGLGPSGTIAVTNNGFGSIDITSITTDSPYFVVQARTTQNCGGTLAGMSTCYIDVAFYAPAVFDYTANLYIGTNDFHYQGLKLALRGHGLPRIQPSVAFTPSPVVFPDTLVGWGADATVTLTNTSTTPLTLTSISIGAGGYWIWGDGCLAPRTLAPGYSCALLLLFQPIGYGLHPGALEVHSNVPGGVSYVSLQGFGIVPAHLSATPAPAFFGPVQAGRGEKATLTIVNDGTVPYALSGFSLVGPDASMFQMDGVSCVGGTPPYSFEPRQTCTIRLAYLPTAAGSHIAMVRADTTGTVAPAFETTLVGAAF